MARYIILRLLHGVIVIIIISVFVFLMMHFLPGDPVFLYLDNRMSYAIIIHAMIVTSANK